MLQNSKPLILSKRSASKDAQRVRRCLFIEGDPIAELRQGRDPHCNAPVAEGRVYCARHCARAYYRPEEG